MKHYRLFQVVGLYIFLGLWGQSFAQNSLKYMIKDQFFPSARMQLMKAVENGNLDLVEKILKKDVLNNIKVNKINNISNNKNIKNVSNAEKNDKSNKQEKINATIMEVAMATKSLPMVELIYRYRPDSLNSAYVLDGLATAVPEITNFLVNRIKEEKLDKNNKMIIQYIDPGLPHFKEVFSLVGINKSNLVLTNGFTLLTLAVFQNKFQEAARLIEEGADVNLKDEIHGSTPLMYALQQDNIPMTKLLLQKNANVNQENTMNINGTPGRALRMVDFIDMKKTNNLSLLRSLSEYSPNGSAPGGYTFLTYALSTMQYNWVMTLLDNGANPNLIDEVHSSTPLMYAVQKGHILSIEKLLEKGAKLNGINPTSGLSTLEYALPTLKNYQDILKIFRKKLPDAILHEGYTFLTNAAREKNFEEISKLIADGANPNLADKKNASTPLMYSVQNGHLPAVELLLQNGAEAGQTNLLTGAMALEYAVATKDSFAEIVKIFRKILPNAFLPGGMTFLTNAAMRNDLQEVSQLLDDGANPNMTDKKYGSTPLMFASEKANMEMVLKLITKGADPLMINMKTGKDAVFYATTQKIKDDLQQLINKLRLQKIRKILLTDAGLQQWADEDGGTCDLKKIYTDLGMMNVPAENLIKEFHRIHKVNLDEKFGDSIPHKEYEEEYVMEQKSKQEQNQEQKQEVKQEEKQEDIFCSICRSEIEIGEDYFFNMADCNCQAHKECNDHFIKSDIKSNGGKICKCPLHGKVVKTPYLIASGLNFNELTLYQDRVLKTNLATDANFHFCQTPDCLNGKKLAPSVDAEWLDCGLCMKSSLIGPKSNGADENEKLKLILEKGKLAPKPGITNPQDPQYLDGRMRPCFYCSTIVERIDGCNSVRCNRCKKNFHWNYGDHRLHPDYKGGDVHDSTNDVMKYTPQNK